jgi:hypothetical protein
LRSQTPDIVRKGDDLSEHSMRPNEEFERQSDNKSQIVARPARKLVFEGALETPKKTREDLNQSFTPQKQLKSVNVDKPVTPREEKTPV